MKKGLAMLLAVAMVLAMGMTAFAAEGSGSAVADAKDVTTNTAGVVVTPTTKKAVADAKDQAAAINTNANVLAVINVQYAGKIPAGGVLVTLNVAGVKKGDNIVLLHQKADGTWERINPTEVGDGYVAAIFKDLSPVAIVKLPANSSAATTGTSPKTGYWG